MNYKGTCYGIEFATDGWRVTVGMRVVCDGFYSHAEAVTWIKGR